MASTSTSPRRPRRRAATALLVLVVLLPFLAGCSDDGSTITVYSGRTKDLIDPLLMQFAEETGISVEVRYADSAELALLISEEGDKSPADVFISQAPGPAAFIDGQDLLAPLDQAILDRVPPEYRAEDGDWVGISARKRVLVYNTDLIDEADLPDSVLELTDPQFEGQVGIAPSNGSFQDFVSAMRIESGDEASAEWLEGMAANDSPTYANNTAIVEAVGRGEVPMGLVNHYYNFRALADDPDLPTLNHDLAGDDLGSLVLLTTASVLKSSDVQSDAEELISFLLSDESQEYFAQQTFEYPVVEGVDPLPQLPPLTGNTDVDFTALGDDLDTTIQLIDDSGLNS